MYWYFLVYLLMVIMIVALLMGGESDLTWSVNGK